MWIARDKNGDIFLYKDKPTRQGNIWDSEIPRDSFYLMDLPKNSFPHLKWEDKPIEIDIMIKPSMEDIINGKF